MAITKSMKEQMKQLLEELAASVKVMKPGQDQLVTLEDVTTRQEDMKNDIIDSPKN